VYKTLFSVRWKFHLKIIYIKLIFSERKRPLGRPRRKWEDNIKTDLQEVGGGCGDWMELD
jgi:hypothetical protein